MTENEAIKALKKIFSKNELDLPFTDSVEVLNMAIQALEEIQQYRKIEQRIQLMCGNNSRLSEMIVDGITEHEVAKGRPIKGVKIVLLTDNCIDNSKKVLDYLKTMQAGACQQKSINALGMAVGAVKKVQEYQAIGTVEEFRNAMERMKPKKPILSKKQDIRYVSKYDCPSCGKSFTGTCSKSCYHCGQALDWSE